MTKIDIDVVYDRMIEKLKASEYLDAIQGIEKSSAGAATGSEALMDQGFYLINLRYSNPSAFKLIESEINDYINYCKQNSLLIRR